MSFLGNISTIEFLTEYWEKKPLLIKNAVPNIESFTTSDDLKELSFDSDFESRIVYNDDDNLSIKHGPLEQNDFNKKGWTLVCHNLNLLDENFYSLQKKLNFLPDWLFDDVMATHSDEKATIGAHIDKYNVFILQGSGKRKWELQTNPDPTYIEDIDLKILKNFNPEIQWVLEPGDMIYIPSNVAHRGISLTDSISYSIGLKSLEDETIIKCYLEDMLNHFETDDYIKDLTTIPVEDPYIHHSEISDYFFDKLQALASNKNQFKLWFNNYLSTPKNTVDPGEVYIEEEIRELAQNSVIKKDIFTKIAALPREEDIAVSINNNIYSLDKGSYQKVKSWFAKSPFEPIEINLDQLNNEQWLLVIDLFKNGTFFFDEE